MPERLLAVEKTIHGGSYQLGVNVAPDLIKGRSQLLDCSLSIANSNNIVVADSTFRRCTILAETRCCEIGWPGCEFDTCIFSGDYYSCDFALSSRSVVREATLRDCDFSTATMHLCRFLGCVLDNQILPRWPHFTIVQPTAHREDANLSFSDDLRFIYDLMSVSHPTVVAEVFYWPHIIAERKMAISTIAVKTLLGSKSYIIL